MSHTRRLFWQSGKPASVVSDFASQSCPDNRDGFTVSPITYTPNRKARNMGRLSSFILRLSGQKSPISDKRSANSLDVPRSEDRSTKRDGETQQQDIRSTPGRRSESRILGFLSSRRSGDCTLRPPSRGLPDGAPPTPGSDTRTSNPTSHHHRQHPGPQGLYLGAQPALCSVTITGPGVPVEGTIAEAAAAAAAVKPPHPPARRSLEAPSAVNPATNNTITAAGAAAASEAGSTGSPPSSRDASPPPAPATPALCSSFEDRGLTAWQLPSAHGSSGLDSPACTPTPSPHKTKAAAEPVPASAAFADARTRQAGGLPLSSAVAAGPAAPPPFTSANRRCAGGAVPFLPEPALPLPPPREQPSTHLLAVCRGAPVTMRRSHWCLEDYAVRERLYDSASSSVYSATCLLSGLPVALKVYNLALVPANVLHMLGREIQIQTSIVHPHCVMLYGAFQDMVSDRLVLVQQLAANGDLQGVHRSLGCRMSEDQARQLVLRPLLEAVVAFHAGGIVHRDIKPENILFTSDWRLLLADFGVAIDTSRERAVTRAGTVGYMAPEVERCPMKSRAEDNKHAAHLAYTTAADVWAIGCLAYMLLLGFPPFIHSTPGEPRGTRCPEGVTAALVFPASTSLSARDFICSALAEHPQDRPTALQLARHPWMMAAAGAERERERSTRGSGSAAAFIGATGSGRLAAVSVNAAYRQWV